jgi:hypothetical protein
LLDMRKHAWLERTSRKRVQLLTRTTAQLRTAWRRDRAGSDGFPFNTAYLIGEVRARLQGGSPRRSLRLGAPKPKPLKQLGDILKEKTVRAVYEYLYEEPFSDAMRQLNAGYREGEQAFNQISEAVKVTLGVSWIGAEMLPKPRGNWLHRQLLEVAKAAHLGHLTNREMAEFFDDLCPCRSKHTRETIKKFRQRRASRPTSSTRS